MAESCKGVILYNPDSLFFIRASTVDVEFGFTVKDRVFLESIPNDLWQLPAISRCSIDSDRIECFINQALTDYEDYALSIPLQMKVKKVFYSLIKTKNLALTTLKEGSYSSRVSLNHALFEVVISRDYWTKRFDVIIKGFEGAHFRPVDEIANKLSIDVPHVDITSGSQTKLLKFSFDTIITAFKLDAI
jgi:hypothetical protein